jgi:excinuclease UvrABC nuclease subunit
MTTITHHRNTSKKIFDTARDFTIYGIGPAEGDPIYIGSTYNLKTRIRAHEHKRKHDAGADGLYSWMRTNEYSFGIVACGTGCNRERLRLEAASIRTYAPKFNKVLPLLTDEERKKHRREHHMRQFAIKEICECGGRTDGLHRHMHRKTKRHLLFIASRAQQGTINA